MTWSFCQAIILYLSMTKSPAEMPYARHTVHSHDLDFKSFYVVLLQLESNILNARSKKKKIIRVLRNQQEWNQRKPSDGLWFSCSYSPCPSVLALSPIPDKWHWSFGLWLWLWIALLQHLPISLLPHCWQEYHPLRCHGSETKTKIEYDVIQTQHFDHSTRSGSGDYKDSFQRFCYQNKGEGG